MLDRTALAALIRAKRGAKRLTQATLAQDIFGDEARKGDISRIERGNVTPQEATLQKLMTALNISEAELAPIRQSRLSAKQLDNIPGLSLDDLQILSSRFGNADAYDLPDTALRAFLTQKAEEYRIYRKQIDALDDRVAAIANLKGGAEAAADALNFDEVESLLSRVDEVETEIAAETKLARARNALLRNDPDHAFQILSAAADSFKSIAPLEPARRRGEYMKLLYQHGLRYPGPAFAHAAKMVRDALTAVPGDQDANLWAGLQNNLGNALQALGTRAQDTSNLEDAVTAYRAALEVFTRDASPMNWAVTQNNLGITLRNLGTRAQDTASLQDAVIAYRAALEVFTLDASPMDWAMTQNNLGTALKNVGTLAQDTATLQNAVTAYRAALKVYTRDASPMDWAMTQYNLGATLADLGTRAQDTASLQDAATACGAALEVRTRDAAPFPHAQTMEALAVAHLHLAQRSDAPNPRADLQTALSAIDTALTIYSPDHTPYDHARATRNRDLIQAALDAL